MEIAKELLMRGDAEAALDRLKNILPTVDTIDEWRVHELIGAAFHDLGDADGAAQAYFNAAMSDRYLRSQRQHFSNYLFTLHYLPNVDAAVLSHEHRVYGSLFRDVMPLTLKGYGDDQKFKIGYLAPHFQDSASARFYEALLTQYDRLYFEITCISLSNERDDFTDRIAASVDRFMALDTLNLEDAARKIADIGLDILFDLGGHSDGGLTLQLMSYRPAPIQIVGIGWFDTTGLDAIDYILTDDFLTPRGDERFYNERLLRVPHAFVFKPPMMADRNHSARSNVTFGAFNNFMKITDDYFECVAEILDRVADSRFILQDTTRLPARQRTMRRRVERFLPIDHVEIRCGRDDYLNDFADIDVMLDTFPYNGGAMTATSLCMNVPVVSLNGDRYGSRIGADILRAAALDEYVANDRDEYIDIAVKLAADRPKNIIDRIKKSALLNADQFVKDIEASYKKLIELYRHDQDDDLKSPSQSISHCKSSSTR